MATDTIRKAVEKAVNFRGSYSEVVTHVESIIRDVVKQRGQNVYELMMSCERCGEHSGPPHVLICERCVRRAVKQERDQLISDFMAWHTMGQDKKNWSEFERRIREGCE